MGLTLKYNRYVCAIIARVSQVWLPFGALDRKLKVWAFPQGNEVPLVMEEVVSAWSPLPHFI